LVMMVLTTLKCRLFICHRYEPEEDQWTNGSWPILRKARLAHGVCVVEGGLYGGRIYTAGGSPEVNQNSCGIVILISQANVLN
jgi:hypothetical protein